MKPNRFYEHTRKQIEHEDNLLNNRMTWLLMLQGFLFSAYGFSVSAEAIAITQNKLNIFQEHLDSIRLYLAILGVVSSLTLLVGIIAASLSMKALKTRWKNKKDIDHSNYPQLLGEEIFGMIGGLVPVFLLPILFPVIWSFLVPSSYVIGLFIILFILGAIYVKGLRSGYNKAKEET